MSTLKNFEPACYIDNEAVALAYLDLAKNFGDEALMTAATNDVTNARKQWRENSVGGSDVTPQTTSLAQ
jgi:hypothetical protein